MPLRNANQKQGEKAGSSAAPDVNSFGLLGNVRPEPSVAPEQSSPEKSVEVQTQAIPTTEAAGNPSPAIPANPPAAPITTKSSKRTGFVLFKRKLAKNAELKDQPAKPDTASISTGQGKGSFLKQFADSLNNFGLGKEKDHFIENLAILLNSGLTVVDALKTIEIETRVKPMKRIILRIIDEVESGIALWRAMDNRNFFSAYALALIRIGEESGSLSTNMEYLAAQQEKNHSLKQKVKMAMIYPGIVLVLTVIITLGLAWFVLPQLVGVLMSLNAELPLVTRMIIVIANFFRDHGTVAVPLFFTFSLLIFITCKYTSLRGPTQQFLLKLPGIGSLGLSATIAQFGIVLGSLLKAGVPMIESLRSTADVTDMVYYRKFLSALADEIETGQSFASAFSRLKTTGKLIPPSVQQLIITGERSGRISEMLLRIADIYEKKAEESATRLPIILEPILLLFIGGLVGTIAFAIIVPIYSIVGTVGR